MALDRMTTDGPSIKHQYCHVHLKGSPFHFSTPYVQLLMFNSVKCGRNADSVHYNHDQHICDHETLLALYVALKLHVVTRKRSLIDAFLILASIFHMPILCS